MTLIVFVLILSLLIFVHEFGHFITAKKLGIKVEEFGFGLPPKLFGKKIGETVYSVNALPIGGFVRLYGEDGEGRKKATESPKKAFYGKSIKVRLAVLVAGVTMNLFLGIVCFSFLYLKLGIPTQTDTVSVIEITKDSPAEVAGLVKDEVIYQINGEKITSSKQFIDTTKELSGEEIVLTVGKESATRQIVIIPRANPPPGEGPLGVVISDTQMKRYPWYQMPYLVVREGFKEALSWSGNILLSLKTMVMGIVLHGKLPEDISGPIGIYQITGQATQAGWLAVIQFMGILSINLAVLNILPFPALDGGRIMFLGYEAITHRRVKPRIELLINNIGMATLLLLMGLITINDIVKLVFR